VETRAPPERAAATSTENLAGLAAFGAASATSTTARSPFRDSEKEAEAGAGHPGGAPTVIVPWTGPLEFEVTVTVTLRLPPRSVGQTMSSGSTETSTGSTTRTG
jgi:hypothetical protein